MEQRIDISKVAPAGFRAVFGLEKYVQGALDHTVLYLIKVRASMVNECAYCMDMHTTDAVKAGESTQRLFGLAAWRESSFYDEQVAKFFSRIYARDEVSVVPLDLVTGPALDVRVPTFRHVLHLEFDGAQIAAVRIQANPDKLSALR